MITMSKKWHKKDYTNISHKKIFENRKETKDHPFVKRFAFLKERDHNLYPIRNGIS